MVYYNLQKSLFCQENMDGFLRAFLTRGTELDVIT